MTTRTTFGRYEIIDEFGRGGMATVFRAYDPNFEREVALKVLPAHLLQDPDLQFRQRFEREAKTIAALEHPAIVPVYDFGEEGGQPYLVMRLMDGGSLSDLLSGQGPLSMEDTLGIFERIGPALDEAHAAGVVHRDIKPDNILFDRRGDAYLSDFGLVKLADLTDSISFAVVLGTPAYMSPEQVHADGEIGHATDIYSLGVTLYESLTGRVPYHDDNPTRLMMKHVLEPVPDVLTAKPDLPPDCAALIARAMAKTPQERYRSVADFVQDLACVSAGEALASEEAPETGSGPAVPGPLTPTDGIKRPATLTVTGTQALTLSGHRDTIWNIVWSPDGGLLASASDDGTVKVWNPATGKQLGALTDPDRLLGLAWSHNGAWLACGTGRGMVVVWDMDSGQPSQTFEGHAGSVHGVAWSPDDARVVSAGEDNALIMWDAEAGEQLATLQGHSRRVQSVAWSPDGVWIVSGAADRRAIVWDAMTGQRVTALEGHRFRVNSVAWSPEGARLVSGSYDGALIVWDADSWMPLGRLEGHVDSVHGVAWSPDGTLLASAGHDHTVVLWDAERGEQAAVLSGHSEAVRSVAWSPDGGMLASASDDQNIILWQLSR